MGYSTAAMACTSLRFLVATAMFALGALAHGQEAEDAAPGPGRAGAFEIQIDAPKDIAALLDRHLNCSATACYPTSATQKSKV